MRERARRLTELAAQNPGHRESRILNVEAALIANDGLAARQWIAALDGEPVTARVAGLHARVAYASAQPDEARLWLAKGMSAPQEPDWSDLDPEGRAFAYDAADWARLAAAYAETGELIHPRHERRERTISDLPELPAAYAETGAFLTAVETGRPPILDDHDFGDGYGDAFNLAPVPAPAPPPTSRRVLSGRGKAR